MLPVSLSLAWSALSIQRALAVEPQRVGSVDHQLVDEQSGIVQSRRWPDTYWVHNDSGDEARLFAIDATGAVIVPPFLEQRYHTGPARRRTKRGDPPPWPGLTVEGASHVDWEDLATDGEHLFIGDMGNNGNARRDLGVYVLREPNPRAVSSARVLSFIPIAYPSQSSFPAKQWHFDCEALFTHSGRLYFVTKHRATGQITAPEPSADLYRLDSWETDHVNVLAHVDHHADLGGWVTAADLSPDGERLAVLVGAPTPGLWLFDTPEVGDAFLSSTSEHLPLGDVGQAEGITWASGDRILVTNEQRAIFELLLE